MFGSARVTVLGTALVFTQRVCRAVTNAIHAIAGQSRWGLTDLYAVICTARFMAAHELLEQAADSATDDDTVIVAARTWPWFGADFVHEESDR